jgi:hypothetical protein
VWWGRHGAIAYRDTYYECDVRTERDASAADDAVA